MKKKLLFSKYSFEWNNTLKKFLNLQRRFRSSDFDDNYTPYQKKHLLSKLAFLFRKLERLQFKVGLKIAGSALAMMLTTSALKAQSTSGFWSAPVDLGISDAEWDYERPDFADLDEDGDMDLYIGIAGGEIKVFKNDGYGQFPDPPENLQADGEDINLGSYAWIVSFVDIDNDGDMDLLASEGYGVTKVYLNQGLGVLTDDGVFQVDGEDFNVENNAQDIAFADLDGDEDLDMYVGTNGLYIIEVFENDGTGAYTYSGPLQADGDTLKTTKRQYTSIAFSDFDDDGDLDLFLGHGGEAPHVVKYYINDNGMFHADADTIKDEAGEIIDFGGSYNAIAFADLDFDEEEEMYVGNREGLYQTTYNRVVGIKPNATGNSFTVYPNPAFEYINFKNSATLNSVKIYDITGNIVAEFENITNKINVTFLEKGLYIVEGRSGDRVFSQKFIKE